MAKLLLTLLTIVVRALRLVFRSRSDLVLENIALKQQVDALKQKRPRPQLDDADRAFWVAMRTAWNGWAERLVIVKPETVVKWHRERFRRYWAEISRHKPCPGRPRVDREIRELIRRMALENNWGAPRIHGELEKLGLSVSEATVSRQMPRRPAHADVVQRWLSFLRNHKECIAAMDFFTVPTASLRVLYCWFVIHHDRRRILHFNATFNPSAAWVIQQLREAFPYDTAPKYLIFDRDSIFSKAVAQFVQSMGTKPCRTAYRSPWQNPVAERWIGGCRRELFDHVIVFHEPHAIRLAPSISTTSTKTARISASARTLRRAGLSHRAPLRPPRSWQCRVSEDSITDTSGAKPPERADLGSASRLGVSSADCLGEARPSPGRRQRSCTPRENRYCLYSG